MANTGLDPLVRPVGAGTVELGADGAPLRFRHPARPDAPWLLQEDTDRWHTALHRWGRGFAVTARGAYRWSVPARLDLRDDTVEATTGLGDELALHVTRRTGPDLTETYALRNRGDEPVTIRSAAVSTPWRDVYDSAADSLARACHAHVWTGGAWAWVLAEPMDGAGPVLGLVLRTGALWAYSVESRSPETGSNVRGHLLLHPTDHARNPDANGGQPLPRLAPGAALTWSWTVGFHADRDAFLATTAPPVSLPRLRARAGEALPVVAHRPVTLTVGTGRGRAVAGAADLRGPAGVPVPVDVLEADGRHSRTHVLFTAPLRDVVRRRVTTLLERHRDPAAEGLRRYAFLAVDRTTGLTVHAPDWPDWTDGAERIGMVALLQQARRLGRVRDPAAVDEAIEGWTGFARAHLVEDDGTVRRDSSWRGRDTRLYDYPWLAHVFADRYAASGASADLELAVRVLDRLAARGGERFLAIGWTEAARRTAGLCRDAGDDATADRVEAPLRRSAAWFASRGTDLAAHEVNYEQTIVAPLVTLLATYGDHDDPGQRAALTAAVRWLTAFGGPQPHVRLHGVPIRHWDGYWFGRDRLWGDVFPHHWAAVTATALTALTALPGRLAGDRHAALARTIWDALLCDAGATDPPTCAYVFPSCVDGRPGDRRDPLSNDQDWALALRLRHGPLDGEGGDAPG